MFSTVRNLRPNWIKPSSFRGKNTDLSQEMQVLVLLWGQEQVSSLGLGLSAIKY